MWHSCLWCRDLKITVLMTVKVQSKRLSWTKSIISLLHSYTTGWVCNPFLWEQQCCWQVVGSGAAHHELREEAGQEEEPVIKINSLHPLTLCTKTCSLGLRRSCSPFYRSWPLSQTIRLNKLSNVWRELCVDLARQASFSNLKLG